MTSALIVAESLPFPAAKGGDLRTWQNLNALASVVPAGVFGLCANDGRRHHRPDLALTCWSASSDPALAWPPPVGPKLQGRAWLLDPHGHPSDLYVSNVAAEELASLLERLRPSVVVMEGLWLHGYLDVVRAAGCQIILDCHNVEAAVFREVAATSTRDDFEGRVIRDVLPARTEAIERRAVCAVDQLWVCSEADADRLRTLYDPPAPIMVIPNTIPLDAYAMRPAAPRPAAGSTTPPTFVFPGIFAYLPNAFAARFLVDSVLPRLAAACGDCRLWLVGPLPPADLVTAAARDPRITVTGPVPDVRPYLAAATAMAVPLFHGGGTRLKILEAFATGLPVISTAKGAEGLGACHGTHLLLAETAEDFVRALLALRDEPQLADRLAAHARHLVSREFSWAAVGGRIERAVTALAG